VTKSTRIALCFLTLTLVLAPVAKSQDGYAGAQTSLYDVPPRWLIDMPTAGTFPRAFFDVGFRFYNNGGALANCDIGLADRITMGISFGGEHVLSNTDPDWNPQIEFNLKLRLVDELELFPAVSVGFCSQGFGPYHDQLERYAYKSRGFYAVVSRSFFFYNWTAGWHGGINYSREYKGDNDKDINFFGGADLTFKYNLALMLEFDAAFNDNKSGVTDGFAGKGRGYLNMGVKWLFTENLEIEFLLKDLLVNRRESDTFERGVRLVYIDRF